MRTLIVFLLIAALVMTACGSEPQVQGEQNLAGDAADMEAVFDDFDSSFESTSDLDTLGQDLVLP
jgi:uncharacterized protein YcfL